MASAPVARGQQVPGTDVFDGIERELEKYDEREGLLATAYREQEQRRGEREAEQRRRQQDGERTQDVVVDVGVEPEGGAVAREQLSACYKEIKNLVLIDESLIHKKALEEWLGKEILFSARVERKTKQVDSLTNEVYQLLGFISVFQGVLLTAVSQSNLLHCNNLWSPVLLSVFTSTVTILAITHKLYHIWLLLQNISSEKQAVQDMIHRGRELRREGKNFVFAKFSKPRAIIPKQDYFWLYSALVIIFLVLLTLAFALSHWRILCYPGSSPAPAPV